MNNTIKKYFNIYLFTFFICCIIGWIYEVALKLFVYNHGFINRGFLYGPYLPVYGFGGVILLLLLNNFSHQKRYIKKINISPVITFILIFFITTIIEYFTGFMLDLIFNIRLWDYSNQFLNIHGLVCFSASFRFAIGGTLLIYFLYPFLNKLFTKFSKKAQRLISNIILLIMIPDLLITLLKYL